MNQIKNKSPFLEEVRKVLRVQHYAIRTEQSYVEWIKRFILFHNKRHPNEMEQNNWDTHILRPLTYPKTLGFIQEIQN
jgi:hypothetical protein